MPFTRPPPAWPPSARVQRRFGWFPWRWRIRFPWTPQTPGIPAPPVPLVLGCEPSVVQTLAGEIAILNLLGVESPQVTGQFAAELAILNVLGAEARVTGTYGCQIRKL